MFKLLMFKLSMLNTFRRSTSIDVPTIKVQPLSTFERLRSGCRRSILFDVQPLSTFRLSTSERRRFDYQRSGIDVPDFDVPDIDAPAIDVRVIDAPAFNVPAFNEKTQPPKNVTVYISWWPDLNNKLLLVHFYAIVFYSL